MPHKKQRTEVQEIADLAQRAESIAAISQGQNVDVTPSDRVAFMSRLFAVKPEELSDAPEPPPVKRGRPPKRSPGPVASP